LIAKNIAKSTAGAVTSIATKKIALSGKRLPPTLRRCGMEGGRRIIAAVRPFQKVSFLAAAICGTKGRHRTAHTAARRWTEGTVIRPIDADELKHLIDKNIHGEIKFDNGRLNYNGKDI
jgi:hypothetical protein